MKIRIKRNFMNRPPGPFYEQNQRIRKGVAENKDKPFLAAHPELIESYETTSEKHYGLYHEGRHGSDIVIAARGILQQQLVIYLVQLASLYEMEAAVNPEVLLTSGFDLCKERRNGGRSKPSPASSAAPNSEAHGNNT